MKITHVLLALMLAALPPAAANAQQASTIIQQGLDAYIKEDAVACMKVWLKGSALESNTQATSQANSLRQIEDFYGKPESYQILGEHPISERSRMVYFVVHYGKGVAYGRMQLYRLSAGAWVSTEFRFHTDATQVFPSHIALGTR